MFGGLEQLLRVFQSHEDWFQQFAGLAADGPRSQVFEQGNKVKVIMEAPGGNRSGNRHQWAFRVWEQNLIVRGTLDVEETGRSDHGGFFSKRSSEQFTKVIPLPSPVKRKPSAIQYEDGLVTLVFDKQPALPSEEGWQALTFGKK